MPRRSTIAETRSQPSIAKPKRWRATTTIKPDYGGAIFNRGLTARLIGDFASGWSCYERRFDREDAPKRKPTAPHPKWDGEDAQGKRILIYEEQGIGDILQFSRYLTLLSSRGARVTFLVRSNLHRLLKSLTPAVRLVSEWPRHESFDFGWHC